MLSDDVLLLLEPSPSLCLYQAQVGENDLVLLAELFALDPNALDIKSSPVVASHPYWQVFLLLSHQPLQALVQHKCRSITLEIVLGGLVVPWRGWKGAITWAFLFKINAYQFGTIAIIETLLVGRIA
jgi:hypothetical protein